MDTMLAFQMGQINRDKDLMVFDWHKAACLIKDSGCPHASAGLSGDWEWTGGSIFSCGKINIEDYTYLASTWAIPEIMIDGDIHECYIMQSDSEGWDSGTKWPQSAIDILNSIDV